MGQEGLCKFIIPSELFDALIAFQPFCLFGFPAVAPAAFMAFAHGTAAFLVFESFAHRLSSMRGHLTDTQSGVASASEDDTSNTCSFIPPVIMSPGLLAIL